MWERASGAVRQPSEELRVRKLICWCIVAVLFAAPPALARGPVDTIPVPIPDAVADATASSDSAIAGDQPAAAEQTPPPPGAVPAWKVGLWKTFTYRVAASIDAFVVGWLWTGSFFGGLGIKALNAVISSTLYDLHEMAWSYFGPPPQSVSAVTLSVWKTVCYRMISIANVFLTAWAFTGDPLLSIGLSLGNAVIDSTIYFFHELAWSYYGPPIDNSATEKPAGAEVSLFGWN